MIMEFPEDSDWIAEVQQLRRENQELHEQRERLIAAKASQTKRLRRIGRMLDEIMGELDALDNGGRP
jgi:hypothetical protein